MAMTENHERRRLPVGIQSFKEIRTNGYVYVDKTDLIWHLVNFGDKFNYFSRPRRFGKSILIDTLQMYLEGRKDLFEGLKIMSMEKDWAKHPVIRLDMSRGGASADEIKSYLDRTFASYEQEYGINIKPTDSLGNRFDMIIKTAYKQSGLQVAILIDEYDSPLQHSWNTPEHDGCTAVYRSVFAILKADDEFEKFVLITGITKFTQISLFSVLNNLTNISFSPEYVALCGITEQEIAEYFHTEMESMGKLNGWDMQETHDHLKEYYDGYHFCHRNMTDIYNPYSLINSLNTGELRNYWASSGATSLLPKFVKNVELRMGKFENCAIMKNIIEMSDVTGGGAELFLYQSGYLTIKSLEGMVYHLGVPNEEVKQALYEMVLPALTLREGDEIQSIQAYLYLALYNGNVAEAMNHLKALIADVPYSNKKMASMDMEERYRLIISTILNAIGFRVEVEKMLSTGRIDIVTTTPHFIYVIELKLSKNGGKKAGAEQILHNQYLEPFKSDKRQTIGLSIELDDLGKGLTDWEEIKR